MRPELAAKLNMHGEELATRLRPNGNMAPIEELAPFGVSANGAPSIYERVHASVLRREAHHRRLPAVADVLAITIMLLLVLNVVGEQRTALLLASMPLVVGALQGRRPL